MDRDTNSGNAAAGASVAATRYFAIDQLRAAMILVVMFGHALLPYVTVPRRFKDPSTHPGFDLLALFLYSFAMPLFFVTAGFAAAALLERRGLRGLLRNRLQAIFLPLLVAYLLLSPLMRAAYAFAGAVSESGALSAGLDTLASGDWLRWSKAYHLWFLVSLLLYTGIALLARGTLRRLTGPLLGRIRTMSRALFAGRWRLPLLSALACLTLVPAYVYYDGDATTPPMQLHLLSFFFVGWLLYLHRDTLNSFASSIRPALLATLVSTPFAVWFSRLRWFEPETADVFVGLIAGISNGLMVASMCFVLLGLFQRYLDDRPGAVGAYVSEASYWIFLIHFPLLIFVAGALSALTLPAVLKYVLTVVVVAPLVFLTYHFLVRRSLLGRLLKGRKPARSTSG